LADRAREAVADESDRDRREARARAVDLEIGAVGQTLEIGQQALVERDRAGDRERGEGAAIEGGQPRQLMRRQRPRRALPQLLQQGLELAPGGLAFASELSAFEDRAFHRRIRPEGGALGKRAPAAAGAGRAAPLLLAELLLVGGGLLGAFLRLLLRLLLLAG